MALKIIRRLLDLRDVNAAAIADGETLVWDDGADEFVPGAAVGGGGGGAPSGAAGGVLGGTYPNPSFAADMATQAELDAHLNDSGDAHDASAISILDTANDFAATDVEGALAELQSDAEAEASTRASADSTLTTAVAGKAATSHAHAGEDITSGTVADARIAATIARDSEVTTAANAAQAAAEATAASALSGHVAAADPHPGYRLESATIVSADIQDGTITTGDLAFDPATQTELDAHVNDATAAHAASAIGFTPNGSIAATDVQAAIQEVRDEAGGGGAPTDAQYIVGAASGGLSAEIVASAFALTLLDDANAAAARATIGAAASGLTRRVRARLDTPDATGNGYPALSTSNGFSNVRRVVPAFTKDVIGTWEGTVEVPQDYASGGAIICSYVCNATSGVYRSQVSTAVVADGVTEDTAYTDETAVDTTVPATAKLRKDVSVTLTTTPVAGSTLNVKVTHAGTHANDTLAVDCLLWDCHFSYVSV